MLDRRTPRPTRPGQAAAATLFSSRPSARARARPPLHPSWGGRSAGPELQTAEHEIGRPSNTPSPNLFAPSRTPFDLGRQTGAQGRRSGRAGIRIERTRRGGGSVPKREWARRGEPGEGEGWPEARAVRAVERSRDRRWAGRPNQRSSRVELIRRAACSSGPKGRVGERVCGVVASSSPQVEVLKRPLQKTRARSTVWSAPAQQASERASERPTTHVLSGLPVPALVLEPVPDRPEEPRRPALAALLPRTVARPLARLERELCVLGSVDVALFERALGRVEARVRGREQVGERPVELVEREREVRPLRAGNGGGRRSARGSRAAKEGRDG